MTCDANEINGNSEISDTNEPNDFVNVQFVANSAQEQSLVAEFSVPRKQFRGDFEI